jgi:hypothetical protein
MSFDRELKFKTADLIDTVVENIGGEVADRFFRSLLWRGSPQAARTQTLFSIARDVKIAWLVLDKPVDDDEYREAAEQALWLRKLTENLVTLVNFAQGARLPDYWLWLSLAEHYEMQRIKIALGRELPVAPTPRQLRPICRHRRTQTSAEILSAVKLHYGPSYATHKPWFMTEKLWRGIYTSEVGAIERWRPPRMRDRMEAVRDFCHPVEMTVLGHYQLTYGRYSSEIHAYQEADQLGARPEDGVLWLSVLAVLHRLAEQTKCEQGAVQLLIAQIVEHYAKCYRFSGPPTVGETASIYGDNDTCVQVIEVSRDAAIAVVTAESQHDTEIRRVIELVPRDP